MCVCVCDGELLIAKLFKLIDLPILNIPNEAECGDFGRSFKDEDGSEQKVEQFQRDLHFLKNNTNSKLINQPFITA